MTPDERLAQLEERVRVLEDRLAINDLVAAYGPAVDAGDAAGTSALWTDDGTYDVDTGVYDGRRGISEMVASRGHQRLISRGCAHLTTSPQVVLAGDTAVAVCHSQLVLRREDGSGFDVLRATAHRFDLVRTHDGWLIERRTSRLLDGSGSARRLLMPSAEAASSDAVHPARQDSDDRPSEASESV